MIIDNALRDYLLIRFVVFLLRAIGPACTASTAYNALKWYRRGRRPTWTSARGYCAAETAFYLFMLCYRTHLQRKAIHPALKTKEERGRLIDKVSSEIHDKDRFLSGWFRGAKPEDVGRDDLKVFVNWAFWEGRALEGDDDEELEQYTEKVAKLLDRPFKTGGGSAKGLHISVDPIEMDCRSLAWYSLIMLLDSINHLQLRRTGFKYHKTVGSTYAVFPPRPAALMASASSSAARLPYWSRPHTSKTRLPILYIHGIGVGLITQIRLLRDLDRAVNGPNTKEDDQVGILAVEVLQISSRLTGSILRKEEFVDQVAKILDSHGHRRFVLASHSYGSVLSSYLLNDDQFVTRIASLLLIDPVSILLHMPDVAYNFTVRPPKTAGEWQLWYFGSKDPGVAHTLGRHLFWSESLLWRDRIMTLIERGMKVTVSLAKLDLIVNTPAVAAYLLDHTIPDPTISQKEDGESRMELETSKADIDEEWKTRPWKESGLNIIWFEELDHAQVFDQFETRKKLVDVLVSYSRNASGEE